jgi:hypothetical protein
MRTLGCRVSQGVSHRQNRGERSRGHSIPVCKPESSGLGSRSPISLRKREILNIERAGRYIVPAIGEEHTPNLRDVDSHASESTVNRAGSRMVKFRGEQ